MRNLKRFLAMTLTMLMVVGCFSVMGVSADFDDVVDYQDQINLLTTLGIIAGKADGSFGYGEDVQRYQMALFVARAATGKVNNDYANWYETENYTGFTDVKADHYLGAISYAAQNGIIKGYSDAKGNTDKFGPADGIMIQDVFTMVVRMLGYGSKAMDANYPWSYVNKAIELGLDNDLAAKYNNEDVATREETVVIIYNALFAKKADGTTIAQSCFNLTQATVVISGTSYGNIYAGTNTIGKTTDGEGYVAFNKLSSAGGVETTPTYWLPVSEFGLEQGDQYNKVGYSYDVITRDNFASLIYASQNTAKVVDQTKLPGTATSNTVGSVDGASYKLVKAYTNLYNTFVNGFYGKQNNGERELILYSLNGKDYTAGTGSYVYDANYNILDYYGNILLYYVPSSSVVVNGTGGTYLYKIADGTYIEPDDSIWERAARVDSAVDNGIKILGNFFTDIYKYNAYSDTVLFDDNADGVYDRGIYTYYSFGFIDYETTATNSNGDKQKYVVIRPHNTASDAQSAKILGNKKYNEARYFDAEGNTLKYTDVIDTPRDTTLTKGNYVLYAYNTTTNSIIIKKIFEPVVGLVTTVDQGNVINSSNSWSYYSEGTITFDQVFYNLYAGNISGTTFHIGNAQLPGARYTDVLAYTDFSVLQGKTVHYIVGEEYGDVFAVYQAENKGRYVVYDSFVGMTSTGYVQALVYDMSNARTAVTIASVDGLWYTGNIYATSAFGFNLEKGDLLYVESDALGISHVTKVDEDFDYTYYYVPSDTDNAYLYFSNGIINTSAVRNDNQGWFEYDNGVAKASTFEKFQTNASTVILVEMADGTIKGYVGIPSEGAKIALAAWDNGRAQVFVQTTTTNGKKVAKLIYVKDGAFDGTVDTGVVSTIDGWASNNASTIIFVDENAKASQLATNQIYTGLSVTLGGTYQYDYVIDFIRGGLTTVYVGASFNRALEAGCFYRVVDGYVTEKINVGDESDVRIGMLAYIDDYYSVVIKNEFVAGEAVPTYDYFTVENQAHILYKLIGTNVEDVAVISGSNLYKPYDYMYYYDTNTAKAVAVINNINANDNYASVYYYNGLDFANVATRVYIYTEAAVSDITNSYTAITVATGAPIIGYKYNTSLTGFTGTEALNGYVVYFQIPKAAYDTLSNHDMVANDNGNSVFAGIGSTMRLYNGSAFNQNFTAANVEVSTEIHTTQANGTRYYLRLEAKNATAIIGSATASLVWTNPNSSVSYKLALSAFSIARAGDYTVQIVDPNGNVLGEDKVPVANIYAPYTFSLPMGIGANAYAVYYNGVEIPANAGGTYTINVTGDSVINLVKRDKAALNFDLEVIDPLWTLLNQNLMNLLGMFAGDIHDDLAQIQVTIGTDEYRISALQLSDLFNNLIPSINLKAYVGAKVTITLPYIPVMDTTYGFVLTSKQVAITKSEVLVKYDNANDLNDTAQNGHKPALLFANFSFVMPATTVDIDVNVDTFSTLIDWTIGSEAYNEDIATVTVDRFAPFGYFEFVGFETGMDVVGNGDYSWVIDSEAALYGDDTDPNNVIEGALDDEEFVSVNPGDFMAVTLIPTEGSNWAGNDFKVVVKADGVALPDGYVFINNNLGPAGELQIILVVPNASVLSISVEYIGQHHPSFPPIS